MYRNFLAAQQQLRTLGAELGKRFGPHAILLDVQDASAESLAQWKLNKGSTRRCRRSRFRARRKRMPGRSPVQPPL